jgi:hypothetical protein
MDQITGNPRSHDESTSGWKFAHQRLSQMLIERGEPFEILTPIIKLDAPSTSETLVSITSVWRVQSCFRCPHGMAGWCLQ